MPPPRLSLREKDVLALLTEKAATNKEIAERLGIGVRTVKFHVSNLLHKFGMSHRSQLILLGKREFFGWHWPT